MNQHKRPYVIIPCSNCGDTVRLNPFDIEAGEDIECPRCKHSFVPSDALMERINEIKKAVIEDSSEDL